MEINSTRSLMLLRERLLRERLEMKIDDVAVGLTLLRDDHKKLSDRVVQAERSLVDLRPQVSDHHDQLLDLTDRIRFLEGRAEDAEGWAAATTFA